MEYQEDIYSALNKIIKSDSWVLDENCFSENICARLSKKEQKIFNLLKKLASLCVEYTDEKAIFSPMIEIGEHRSFGLKDMSDDDYSILDEIEIDKLPILLQARVSDVLWTERKKYEMVPIAIKAYHELYIISFDLEDWPQCFEYIKRSITLAAKTGNNNLYNEYMKEIFNKVIQVNGNDKSFFSISVIEFLILQKWKDYEPLFKVLDNIIEKSNYNVREEVHKTELAYKLKSKLFIRKQDIEGNKENNRKWALFYEKAAEQAQKEIFSLFIILKSI